MVALKAVTKIQHIDCLNIPLLSLFGELVVSVLDPVYGTTASSSIKPVVIESAHPYDNNMDQ
jgi:hypothetical protein